MSKWEKVKLGDVCEFIDYRGKTPTKSDSGIPLITAKNIKNNKFSIEPREYISNETYEKVMVRGYPEIGDVLFTTEAPLGNVCLIPAIEKKFAVGQRIIVMKPYIDKLISYYMVHALRSISFQNDLNKYSSGSTVKGIRSSELIKIKIPLPPLEVQKQIAQNLDIVSELLALRKKQLEELDELIKSVFYDMFGDPVTNDKGWEIRRLKDITVSIQSGNTPKGGEQVYVNSGVMFFRSQNIWRNRIEINDIAYIDEQTHKKMGKTSLKHKDILITKTGRFNTENSSLGRAALFLGEDRSANINGHVYLVRLKEGYVHEFVLYILITDEYKDYIRTVCVGGIDKRQINKEHLEEFPIIIPPSSLQNEFATIVTKIEEQKSLVKQSIEETQQLFDSLMSQYFD